MDKKTIKAVEAGEMCQCCGMTMAEKGEGKGKPISCSDCKKRKLKPVPRKAD